MLGGRRQWTIGRWWEASVPITTGASAHLQAQRLTSALAERPLRWIVGFHLVVLFLTTAMRSVGQHDYYGQLGYGSSLPQYRSYSPVSVYGSNTWDTSTGSILGVTGATSCTVSPALPTGLNIDTSTCTISGTPSVATSNTTYNITADISGTTYQGTVWLSSSYPQLTPSVEGAELVTGQAMTDITFNAPLPPANGSIVTISSYNSAPQMNRHLDSKIDADGVIHAIYHGSKYSESDLVRRLKVHGH